MSAMITEGIVTESVEDLTVVTQSDENWYVEEVIAPTWEHEISTTGWLHATVEDMDKITFPDFDLLGEPW